MHKLCVGPKGQKMFAICVSTPNSIIDLKAHCRNMSALLLSDSDYNFAFANGLSKMLSDSIVRELANDEVYMPEENRVSVKPEPATAESEPASAESTDGKSIMEVQEEVLMSGSVETASEEIPQEDSSSSSKKKKKAKRKEE